MLFQSSVPFTINKIGFHVSSQANQARKEEAAKRLDYYHDEQLSHLEVKLNELFSDPSSMVKVELNLVKKIINNLAQVYQENPIRTIEGTEADQKIFRELEFTSNMNIKMKQASRYCKLLKTILLRPVWRNNKLDLDILTGNILDVETGESPETLESVLVTDYGNSEKIEDISYSLWTPQNWKKLDYRGNIIEQKANPYKILPFLGTFDFPPTSNSFWLPGGSDLIALQEAINIKLVDLIYLLSQQSFGVGYIKGTPAGGKVRVDPGSLVELPENGEIGFESQKAEIKQVVDAIDKIIKWACVSNGLSAGSMSTDVTEASGLSKLVDKGELAEIRQDDIALWRNYEKQLFQIIKVVWNTHNPQKFSETATLTIDFADPIPQVDPKTQSAVWDIQLAMGVISPVDILLEMNPDFQGNREDALSHLLKVKNEIMELQ